MKDRLLKLQDYANSLDNLWLENEIELLGVDIKIAILQAETKSKK